MSSIYVMRIEDGESRSRVHDQKLPKGRKISLKEKEQHQGFQRGPPP